MPELDQSHWTRYRVGTKSSNPNWTEQTCQPLERVMHVTHIRHALSILDDGRIRQRLVYDTSRLTSTRIHVVWLSPNRWDGAGGSRYGSIEFAFEWRTLVKGKHAYWIGAANYSPRACRILLTDSDYSSHGYRTYDPTLGDGPWWHEVSTDRHWWNGDFCLEIMVESDVKLASAREMNFTKHHRERCNIEPGGKCRDAGMDELDASAELLCAWASGIYSARPFSTVCRGAIADVSWRNLTGPFGNIERWGSIVEDDPIAPMLGRALLSAGARKDRGGVDAIAAQFASPDAAKRALRRIVAESFEIEEALLR